MNNNELLKIFLSSSRDGLRCLHGAFGFDFCKPYKLYMIKGKYTLNQVSKMVARDGLYFHNANIIICTRNVDRPCYNKFRAVKMTSDTGIEHNYRFYRYCNYSNYGLDYFTTKSSFEEVRKSETAETFIFAQSLEFCKIPVEVKPDYNKRFKYLDSRKGLNAQGVTYIYKVEVMDRERRGEKYEKGATTCGRECITQLHDFIDKSGYFVDDKRANLRQAAEKLRRERAKQAFIASDNSATINKLWEMIEARHAEIVDFVNGATTLEEFKIIDKIFDRWHGFSYIVESFEDLKERETAKKYGSIEDFKTACNGIINAIERNRREAAEV